MSLETNVKSSYEVIRQKLVDTDRKIVREITEAAFGQKLREDYFTDQSNKDAAAYLERNGRGVAIVLDTKFGKYLDLIAVRKMGNGTGTAIMSSINHENASRLFWRSKLERKEANDWYIKISDGHQRCFGPDNIPYNVYWKGAMPNGSLYGIVDFASTKISNFEPKR